MPSNVIAYRIGGAIAAQPPHRPALSRLLDWIQRLADRSYSRHLLQEMDARMLRDIGLSRSQALEEARKPFWIP